MKLQRTSRGKREVAQQRIDEVMYLQIGYFAPNHPSLRPKAPRLSPECGWRFRPARAILSLSPETIPPCDLEAGTTSVQSLSHTQDVVARQCVYSEFATLCRTGQVISTSYMVNRPAYVKMPAGRGCRLQRTREVQRQGEPCQSKTCICQLLYGVLHTMTTQIVKRGACMQPAPSSG